MPTTYTGDKTATELPSDPPEPQGAIQVSLPADGDPPNASTFEQAYKVCADFIDWLMQPQAAAGVSNWVKSIIPFRAANGHRRFAIDHLGFPTGQLLVHDVVWKSTAILLGGYQGNTAEAQNPLMPEWRYKAVTTYPGSGVSLASSLFGPSVQVVPGRLLNEYVTFSSGPFGTLRADSHAVLEFTATIDTAVDETFCAGMCPAPATHIEAEAAWAGFRYTGTTWICVSKNASVETVTDSLVTPPAFGARPDRLRVEWHGATVADDTTAAMRFYVNGALVATHTTNLPLAMYLGIAISGIRGTAWASGADGKISVGPMRLRLSLHNGDSVL